MEINHLLLIGLTLFLALLLYLVYHFVIKIYIEAARFKKMDPTLKTFVSPFTGLLGLQKQNIEKYGDSHRFVKDMVKQNPNQKAYFTNIGSRPFLILCQAQLIKELSMNPKKFKKFNLFKHSNRAYTKGIFLVEDEQWNSQRQIIRHSFNHEQLKKMIPQMKASIETFATKILDEVKISDNQGRVYNVMHDTALLIGEILVRIFFSEEALTKKVYGKQLSIALADFTTTMFERSRSGQNILFSLFFGQSVSKMSFTKKDKELEDHIIEIRRILAQILHDRMNKQNDEEKDFLYNYIQQMRKSQTQIAEAERKGEKHNIRRITEEEIMHQLISFYFAGIDTTGHLVAFVFYALAEYPEVRQKVTDEIQKTIGSTEDITYENLQKLEYLGKVLDECLRMWPPAVGILCRMTREDTKIGPYEIPKGMLVGTNIIGLMHNEKYYQSPEMFNPDRWDNKSAISSEPYCFIPFSAGTRSCIGKYLALMQTKLIVIKFLNIFNFERTKVPLRLHAKFLYEPIDEDLLILKEGGMQIK